MIECIRVEDLITMRVVNGKFLFPFNQHIIINGIVFLIMVPFFGTLLMYACIHSTDTLYVHTYIYTYWNLHNIWNFIRELCQVLPVVEIVLITLILCLPEFVGFHGTKSFQNLSALLGILSHEL